MFVHGDIYDYIVRLAHATREHKSIRQGASPRCSVAAMALAQACAWMDGRDYVVPEDVKAIYPDCTAHRLLLTAQAKAQGVQPRELLDEILRKTPAPKIR